MQTTSRTARLYWATPILGVVVGIVYLIAFAIGGRPLDGAIALAVVVAFSAAIARRSETVRGLLDHRDERITGIDLRATAVTAVVMILAVLAGFVFEVARGRSGSPYEFIAAAGGLACIAAVAYFRIRS
jgi:hypothetical protein